MNKGSQTKLLILLGVTVFVTQARELRVPWVVQDGPLHYKEPRPKDDDTCWNYDVWNAGYATSADKGYTDKHSLETESLTGIWFGKENFTLLEAFAPGSYDPENPLLGVLELRPRFDFAEHGAYFGLNIDRAFCCGKYHAGVRVNLPVRHLKVELNDCCNLEEGLPDVCVMKREQAQTNRGATVGANQERDDQGREIIEDSYAYRLDFLASLPLTNNIPTTPLVKFNDPNHSNHITINQIDVTQSGADLNDIQTMTKNVGQPIHVVMREDETPPKLPCSLVNAPEITGVGGSSQMAPPGVTPESAINSLTGDGQSGFTDAGDGSGNQRSRFTAANTYDALGGDVAQQRKLWVVPTTRNRETQLTGQPTVSFLDISEGARNIQTAVSSILKNINTSAIEFLKDKGLTFASQHICGLGDLDADFYIQRHCPCWYGEFLIGLRFPTGKKIKDPSKLLLFPATGNNGHWEIKFGGELGWEVRDWLNIELGAFYHHAFKRTEKVNASFKGATVKNIGPAIDAEISWGYFLGNIDFTFRVPCNPFVGVTYGYSPFVKQEDSVKFKQTTAEDLFGVERELDSNVLELRTKAISHQFRVEGFYQGCYGEVFGGFTRIFGGKNAMRESTYYLGFVAYF